MSRLPTVCLITLLLAVAGCPQPEKGSEGPPPSPTAQEDTKPREDPMPPKEDLSAALLDPSLATATAPDVYKARFETSKGSFVVEVHRDWAPLGADRFFNLVRIGFYDDARFFRVLQKPTPFMAQWGINGDPQVMNKWREVPIKDDPVKNSNTRGIITFAMAGPDTRTTHVFVNYGDNSRLDDMGFAPFGKVIEGMEVVDSLYGGYGEGAPQGNGPDHARVAERGNAYLEESFPKMDWTKKATIVD